LELNPNKIAALSITLLSSLVLAACGGGGGGGASTSSAGSTTTPGSNTTPTAAIGAEGAYIGTVSNGFEHNTIVLEDGQYYSLYGMTSGGGFAAAGFLQGSGQSNSGSFSSSDLKDYAFNGAVFSGTLSTSYTASSFNGTLTEGASSATFTGAPIDVAVFNYNSAANLSAISGTWSLTSMQNDAISVTIATDGSFSATSDTCSITGAITPRPSGKNVFNVTQTYGSTCPLAGQSASGIALTYLLSNGQRQLIVAETTASRVYGTTLFGVR
jgi:hypothetical protein